MGAISLGREMEWHVEGRKDTLKEHFNGRVKATYKSIGEKLSATKRTRRSVSGVFDRLFGSLVEIGHCGLVSAVSVGGE